ncbi:MAG: valine--tRNA ligase [Caldiserica bacterium]|nr:valine--tRNA ligase [Caldisericota bacterium]
MELPARYDPRQVEDRILRFWLDSRFWVANPRSGKPPFSIVIPPPNVTGRLHMGHALNNTLQDIVTRYKRMDGYEVCWFPGVDHAGIATQNVVEQELAKEGLTRHDLGREKFLERVWAWKEKYGNEIVEQLKALGASCDWSRLRFTLDPGFSRAVREAFVRFYDEGLIYRGDYMINWCPRCGTTLSDIEVEHKEVQGHLYYIRYPLEEGGHVVIATTRPETMLGDTGVAVNPDDPRYKHLIGKTAVLPIIGRKLPIVAAPEVDPEFGTGVLKVTPGHDPVDFEIGKREGLPAVNILNPDGTINDNGGPFAGMDRYAAREAVVRLQEEGLLEKVEPYRHSVGHCYRCGTAVEPLISTQWFVRMKPLAEPAIEAVRSGRIRFVPERWTKVYFEWLENIRDWCISRQLWWGHRIPAWNGPDGEVFVGRNEEEAKARARERYGEDVPLRQEEDVLDTWFSSALWPFGVMGWPEETEDLKTFYPTSLLITGFDILFFWVARMIMTGLHFMGEIPFREVYITPLIVDEKGQKMSKSRGNIIDPMEVKESHGMDALRFTLSQASSKGRSWRLSWKALDDSRNFLNKIWNMARFIVANTRDLPADASPSGRDLLPEDRWILSRISWLAGKVRAELDKYNFHLAAEALYDFTWHDFCDWYLELSKIRLYGDDPEARHTAQAVLVEVLDRLLRLLHPFMPFITEEIWRILGRGDTIATAPFPREEPSWRDPAAEEAFERFRSLAVEIRAVRAELGVPASAEVEVILTGEPTEVERLLAFAPAIRRLCRAAEVRHDPGYVPGPGTAKVVLGAVEAFIPLAGTVDLSREKGRIRKDLAKVERKLSALEARLANEEFRRKAPEEVVRRAEEEAEELRAQRERLKRYLEI